MKLIKTITSLAVLVCCLAANSYGALSLNFANVVGGGIQFNGSASSFQLNPGSSSFVPGSVVTAFGAVPQFQITSVTGGSSALGLYGSVDNSPWTIGAVTTSGNLQYASVGGSGALRIFDGTSFLTGNVNWIEIRTDLSAGAVNAGLSINVTGLTYSGSNVDLLALAADNAAMNLTFQFSPGETLSQLVVNPVQVSSYSGSISPIPEPSTVVAAALLLLPFGASTIRILRKNRQA